MYIGEVERENGLLHSPYLSVRQQSKTMRNPEAEGTAQRVPYLFVRQTAGSVAVNDAAVANRSE